MSRSLCARLRAGALCISIAALGGAGGALLVTGGGSVAGAIGSTRYVATTGSDGANTCLVSSSPCRTLGRALSVAAPGDTIHVSAGTYPAATDPSGTSNTVPSALTSLTIEGVSGKPSTVVITGKGVIYALAVNADGTTVEDLTIQNSGKAGLLVSPPAGASTPASVTHETIATNDLVHNDRCGWTPGAAKATPTGCKTATFVPDYGEGMHLMSVATSTISGNTITHNIGGMLVTDEMGPTHNDTISSNTSSTNTANGGDCGITLAGHNTSAVHTSGPTIGKPDPSAGGDYTLTVTGNVADGNGAAGLLDAGGPPGTGVYHNTFTHNRADGNVLAGFTLHSHAPLQDMNTNVVETNTFANNGKAIPGDPEGPPASADQMQSAGVELLGAIAPVTGTTVEHNTISTEFYGVWLSPHELHTNAISSNTITVDAGGTAVFSEPAPNSGYVVAEASGAITGFGTLPSHGSVSVLTHAVGVAETNDGGGYWVATSNGTVVAVGDASALGTLPSEHVKVGDIVGIAAAPTGYGYWLVGADGGVFTFGAAAFHGSMGGHHLAKPVVGITAAPTGGGYWLVAADGGVFTFGAAAFHGSMGGHPLAKPVVAIAAAPTGGGYWLVAADGGVFTFGKAAFHGSMGGHRLAQPVVGMAAAPTGGGYWLVAADGGVFTFGSASFHGSLPGHGTPATDVVGITTNPA